MPMSTSICESMPRSTIRILVTNLATALVVVAAALIVVAAAAPAQTGAADCPHQGVRPVPSKITYGPLQKCGTGMVVRVRGVTLRNPLNACPLFAIYEPPHDKPTPKQNFRTRADRALPIVMIKMKCSTDLLLGFIPIPIGSSCGLAGTTNIGWIQNYVESPCDDHEKTRQDR